MNARALTCSLLLLLPLTAQQAPTAPPPPKPADPTVTLAFAGGTLAEFVAQLRRVEPRANVVVANAANGAVLPAIDLRGAGLDQALASACSVAVGEHPVRVEGFRGPGEPVYTILAVEGAKGAPGGGRAVRTEVFGLARLTEGEDPLSHEWLLGAIEAAVGEPKLAALKLHRESNLMIARGSAEQLDVVQSVLRNLDADQAVRRERKQQASGAATPDGGTDKPLRK